MSQIVQQTILQLKFEVLHHKVIERSDIWLRLLNAQIKEEEDKGT